MPREVRLIDQIGQIGQTGRIAQTGRIVQIGQIGQIGRGQRGVWRALARISASTIASGCLKSSWALVDTFVAGRPSTVSLAGLGAAGFFAFGVCRIDDAARIAGLEETS